MSLDRIRYFIGIAPDEAAREQLAHAASAGKSQWSFAQWTHPSDYHITLAFLGDLTADQAAAVRRVMADTTLYSAPFKVSVMGWGSFGPPQRPAILWAGVPASAVLTSLHKEVWRVMEPLGFEQESRPFTPHLTVARRSLGTTASQIKSFQDSYPISPISWEARLVILFRTLFGKRPAYEVVSIVELQATVGIDNQ